MGGGIRSCDICDPYITILLNNGTVGVLELTAQGEQSQQESAPVTLKLSWPEIEMVCKVVSQCVCVLLEEIVYELFVRIV